MRTAALPDTDDEPDGSELRDRQVAVLDRLTVMGMAIAEAIHREVEAGLADETDSAKRMAALNTAAVAHARAARAVRLAVALQHRLLTGGHPSAVAANDAFDGPITVEWLAPEAAPDAHPSREHDRERDDGLTGLHCPPAEVIALICRDLGLDDETTGRFNAAWALATDDPSSPHGARQAPRTRASDAAPLWARRPTPAAPPDG